MPDAKLEISRILPRSGSERLKMHSHVLDMEIFEDAREDKENVGPGPLANDQITRKIERHSNSSSVLRKITRSTAHREQRDPKRRESQRLREWEQINRKYRIRKRNTHNGVLDKKIKQSDPKMLESCRSSLPAMPAESSFRQNTLRDSLNSITCKSTSTEKADNMMQETNLKRKLVETKNILNKNNTVFNKPFGKSPQNTPIHSESKSKKRTVVLPSSLPIPVETVISDDSLVNKEISSEDTKEPENLDKPVVQKREKPNLKLLIIRKNIDNEYAITDRIKVIKKYTSKIHPNCNEAIRAERYGSFTRKEERKYPGIPSTKFAKCDYEKHGSAMTDWPVQTVFRDGEDETSHLIYYEGWTSHCLTRSKTSDFKETAPEILQDAEIRDNFIKEVKYLALLDAVKLVNKKKEEGLDISCSSAVEQIFVEPSITSSYSRNTADSIFWLYQDLNYFHTHYNKAYGMAPIYYMACCKANVKPPYYAYTVINVVEFDVYNRCIRKEANKSFNEILNGRAWLRNLNGACENVKECKCDARFSILYAHKDVQHLQYKSNGLLDFTAFDLNKQRIVMECSDICGCSSSCPRRTLQRGQQHPVVVYYESHKKGFGLRAAAPIKIGDVVCEYTGVLRRLEPSQRIEKIKATFRKDAVDIEEEMHTSNSSGILSGSGQQSIENVSVDVSYDNAFNLMDDELYICAKDIGNAARFINHSCDSNTAFVEVYSRELETDPLIPRIGIYAIKDIPLGHEITIRYYDSDHQTKRGVKCECKSKNCMGLLPTA